jgi:hypothetical protein
LWRKIRLTAYQASERRERHPRHPRGKFRGF